MYDDERNKRSNNLDNPYPNYLDHDKSLDSEMNINNNSNKKEKTKKQGSRISYFLVAVIGAVIGGLISQLAYPLIYSNYDSQTRNEVVINSNDDLNTVSAVAKHNMGSVVGITTVEIVSDFYFFLPREVEGVGSGVIVDPNGYILTNSHVVGGGNARSLEVLLENGEKIPGEVLWSDKDLDLAMVKINKTGLQAAKLGDSDKIEVGELAIAIGNPLGLDYQRSVTAGVISGLNRKVKVSGATMSNLIQTDASINSGNSGGPLFNKKGEVIGINTLKVGGSAEGLGFSIPINETKKIIESVIEKGTYEKAVLGIQGGNLENEPGVLITQVYPDSPGEKAGLKRFDIIIGLDGDKISDINELISKLSKYSSGDKAVLKLIRSEKEIEIEIKF